MKREKRPKETMKILLRLLSYLIKEKKILLFVFFLIVVYTLCNLIGSYLLRPIINDAIIPKDIEKLIRLLLLLASVYLGAALTLWLQYRILNIIGQRTVANLRKDLFNKMERLPVKFFDTHQHGEVMSRFTNDMDRVSEVLTETLSDMLTNVLSLIGVLIMMLYISPLLTLTTVIIVPLMLMLARLVVKRSKYFFREQQKSLGEMNGYVEEIITGQKTVKIFSHEQIAEEEFDLHNEQLKERARNAQLFSGLMMPLMQNLNTLNFVFVSIIGGLLAILRGFDLGGLAAFLQYSRQFGRPINELSAQYNTLQAAIAGAERIFRLMDELPEGEQDSANTLHQMSEIKGEIVFKEVNFSYLPDVPVLRKISLHAIPGKKIALVGSTGAGKTTIFNVLPRFYEIDAGEIDIDGVAQNQIKRSLLRRSMALVLQDTHLFTGTVMENIRYGKLDATDDEVVEAAKLAAAHSFIEKLPQGYQTELNDDAANLSQGQRQLLNIARAAIADPPILLLDEATSDVDSRTELLIQRGMDRLMSGRTTLIIAHRLSTVKNADEILVIENGMIVERGVHSELLLRKGRYFQLYTREPIQHQVDC